MRDVAHGKRVANEGQQGWVVSPQASNGSVSFFITENLKRANELELRKVFEAYDRVVDIFIPQGLTSMCTSLVLYVLEKWGRLRCLKKVTESGCWRSNLCKSFTTSKR